MKAQIVLILFALILASTIAFAAPNVTTNSPTANQTVYGGRTLVLDFNVLTEDANGILAATDTEVGIYYSTIAGSRSYLIYQDTNLFDATGIQCADYNFVNTTDCNYTWSVPGAPNIAIGSYYLDYNLSQPNYVAGGRTNTTKSSSVFQIQQPVSSTIVAMIALALFIGAAALAVFAVMGLGRDMDMTQFVMMVVVAIILLVIAWTLYGITLAV